MRNVIDQGINVFYKYRFYQQALRKRTEEGCFPTLIQRCLPNLPKLRITVFINTFQVSTVYFHNNVIVIAYFQKHARRRVILLMCQREVRLLSARRQHN